MRRGSLVGFLLAQAVVAASAQPAAQSGSAPAGDVASRVLTCEGLFGKDASHAKLVEAFGAKNVTSEKQDGPEGQDFMATVLFSKSPADRLVISWNDPKRRRAPDGITAKAGASWHLPNGIKPGATLAEVEAANGKPFDLSGFEWDYGGFVSEWHGGAMAAKLGRCFVGIRFAPSAAVGKASGDKTFKSTDAAMKAAKPVVSDITISPPQ